VAAVAKAALDDVDKLDASFPGATEKGLRIRRERSFTMIYDLLLASSCAFI
jgi:hypothetical protein